MPDSPTGPKKPTRPWNTDTQCWKDEYAGISEQRRRLCRGVLPSLLWIQYFLWLQALPAGTNFPSFFCTNKMFLPERKSTISWGLLYLPLDPLAQLSQEILFCQFDPNKKVDITEKWMPTLKVLLTIITNSLWINTICVQPDDRLKRELETC